jgi:hypothetical protein
MDGVELSRLTTAFARRQLLAPGRAEGFTESQTVLSTKRIFNTGT